MEEDVNITDGISLAWDTVNQWVEGFYKMLPNLAAGFVILSAFLIIAVLARLSTRAYFARRDRIDLGHILSTLGFWFFTLLGVGIALTVIMPSLEPGNLVASFGVGSIALGFVFKEIFQNWFAGLLILLRLPFRRGDQITVGDASGTVMRIDPRATILRTFDNDDIVVPNYTIYQTNVRIHTSQKTSRVEINLTVGYNYDIRMITKIIENSLAQVEEILTDPQPQVLCWELGSTSLGIKARWWVDSGRSEINISRARAIQAIKEAFDANNIDPTDPQLIYYHEAKDGDNVLGEANNKEPKEIKHGPKPPEFKTCANDPERESIKTDDMNDTLLGEK